MCVCVFLTASVSLCTIYVEIEIRGQSKHSCRALRWSRWQTDTFTKQRPREKNPTRATFTTDVEPIPTRHPRPPPAPFSFLHLLPDLVIRPGARTATSGRKAGIRPSGQGRRRLAITSTTKPSKSSLPNRARGNTNPPALPTHVRYI